MKKVILPRVRYPPYKMASVEGINLEGDAKSILTQFIGVYKTDMLAINSKISEIQGLLCTEKTLKEELKKSKTSILQEVTKVKSSVDEITQKFNVLRQEYDKKVADLEERIITLETQDPVARKEFDPDYTCVLSGCKHSSGEDLLQKCKDVLSAIGHSDKEIIRTKRVGQYDNKPGIIKIELQTLKDKIEVLKSKGALKDIPRYSKYFLRSSQSHEQQLLQQHTNEILEVLGKKDDYYFNGSGKLIKKSARGSNNQSSHSLGDVGGELIAKLERLVNKFPTPESSPAATTTK